MKTSVKSFLWGLAGFVIGVVVCGVFYFYSTKRIMAFYQGAIVQDAAFEVRELQSGKADRVLELKKAVLPGMVLTYDKMFRKYDFPDRQDSVMGTVARCYQESPDEVPSSIKPIIDALPPRPLTSCEKKTLEEEKASQAETSP